MRTRNEKGPSRDLKAWQRETPENAVKMAVLKWAGFHNYIAVRVNNVRLTSKKGGGVRFLRLWAGQLGAADIFLFVPALDAMTPILEAIAVETKTMSGKLSSDQVHWRDEWIRSGGRYVCARSVDDVIACVTRKEGGWPIE